MDRLLVEIVCAATIKKYDFWIPKRMKIQEVIARLMEEIEAFEGNTELFERHGNEMLIHYERQLALNPDYTMEQSGIVNGQRLMLI